MSDLLLVPTWMFKWVVMEKRVWKTKLRGKPNTLCWSLMTTFSELLWKLISFEHCYALQKNLRFVTKLSATILRTKGRSRSLTNDFLISWTISRNSNRFRFSSGLIVVKLQDTHRSHLYMFKRLRLFFL